MASKVYIIGYGPSGIGLVEGLLRGDLEPEKIIVYTGSRRYVKPCGEAVLSTRMPHLSPRPPILYEIRLFRVGVEGFSLSGLVFRDAIWYIIDKARWIEDARERHANMGVEFRDARVRPSLLVEKGVVFDARGPYSYNGLEKIPVGRALVDAEESMGDSVELVFDMVNIGFYWVFPGRNGSLNVGYGSIGVRDPSDKLFSFIRARLGLKSRLREKRVSLITIGGVAGQLFMGRLARVGEAAGYVYPLTGEGIGPSYIHGFQVGYHYAVSGDMETAYRGAGNTRVLREISRGIRLQRRLLETIRMIPPEKRLMLARCIDNGVIERLLTESLGLSSLLPRLARCPWILRFLRVF